MWWAVIISGGYCTSGQKRQATALPRQYDDGVVDWGIASYSIVPTLWSNQVTLVLCCLFYVGSGIYVCGTYQTNKNSWSAVKDIFNLAIVSVYRFGYYYPQYLCLN